jgi:hypothetical protein
MMGTGYTGGWQIPDIHIREQFAWLPWRMTSGKWIWCRKYVKLIKIYWGPAGEGPAICSEYYTEDEWTLELLRNDYTDVTPKPLAPPPIFKSYRAAKKKR